MGELIELISGQDLTPEQYSKEEIGIPYITGASNFINNKLDINRYTNSPSKIAYKGDLLITCKGTIGEMLFLEQEQAHIARQIMAVKAGFYLNKYFLKFYLHSYINTLKSIAKSMIPGISRNDILDILFPLPPLPEQHRIVQKIEELLPLVEQYDKTEQKLTALNTNFPEQLKKSVLQAAIQGKLTEQNPNDEPAFALIERIKAEKNRLIAEKKLKKPKSVAEIVMRDNLPYEIKDGVERCIADEVPFDIPENWCWVRLEQLGEIIGGGTPKTTDNSNWDNGTIPWLTPADMKFISGKFVSRGERNITEKGLSSSSAKILSKNSIVYSSRAPIGYIAITDNELSTNQGFKSIELYIKEIVSYIYYALISLTPEIQSRASGTTFKEISGTEFGKTIIPIPPLNEQYRIVQKIEQLFTEIEKL